MIENKGINTVMNSFNRLSYTYRFILIEKYYLIIIKKTLKILCFQKKCLYLQYRKKQLKLTIMKKENETLKQKNYRITVITKSDIIVKEFYNDNEAMDTITKMKELFPNSFIGGALEKKDKRWNVIWTLGNN